MRDDQGRDVFQLIGIARHNHGDIMVFSAAIQWWEKSGSVLAQTVSLPFRKRKLETEKPKAGCKQPLDPFHGIGAVNHVLARRGGERAVKNEHHKYHDHKN